MAISGAGQGQEEEELQKISQEECSPDHALILAGEMHFGLIRL